MSSYQYPSDHDYIQVDHRGAHEDWEDAAGQDFGDLPTPRLSKLPAPSSLSSGKSSRSKHRKGGRASTQSGSDTEREPSKMSPTRSSKHSSSSSGSRKDKSSSSRIKKTDDWTEVTEPDERRRIQNRIAQRKFREKAREQRDRAQRDAQNQQYAGSTYHIPAADDLMVDDGDLSGLPWGGINMRHVVARGHAASATSSHHTHSHHSSDSAVAAYRRDSGNNNANPAPGSSSIAADVVVDHALYNLNPYGGPGGYGPPATSHHAVAMGYAGDGTESSHGYYHHDSPYGGYYDYDAPPTTGPGHYPA